MALKLTERLTVPIACRLLCKLSQDWRTNAGPIGKTHLHLLKRENRSWQDTTKTGVNRSSHLAAAFTSFGLLLYGFKDRLVEWKGSLLPTAFAISRDDGNFRSRFNFVADVVDKCTSSVVCIESEVLRFGVQNTLPRGSGFIVREDGLILTNAHVVINKPRSLQVKLKDGRKYDATIEDVDMTADLATIRIHERNLPVMKLGSSDDLRAGEWVVAIGNPFSLTNSVSAGVVSAPQRKAEDLGLNSKDLHYIQTDASMTFGNSGGPLVNLDGEAVGINSMKVVPGISFAIPIEYAKEFLKRNEEERKAEGEPRSNDPSQKRGFLGIVFFTLTPSLFHDLGLKQYRLPEFLVNKVVISEVGVNTPAYRCGLQPGDIITEINGKEVEGVGSVYEALSSRVTLHLKVYRNDAFFSTTVTPEFF